MNSSDPKDVFNFRKLIEEIKAFPSQNPEIKDITLRFFDSMIKRVGGYEVLEYHAGLMRAEPIAGLAFLSVLQLALSDAWKNKDPEGTGEAVGEMILEDFSWEAIQKTKKICEERISRLKAEGKTTHEILTAGINELIKEKGVSFTPVEIAKIAGVDLDLDYLTEEDFKDVP